MKLPEHLALSFLVAQFGIQQEYGPVGTALVLAAGVLPDLDVLSILGGWQCHRAHHRVLGHGLPMTVGGPLALAAVGWWLLGGQSVVPLWLWLQVSLLAHLGTDVFFYSWPVQLGWPLSRWGIGFGLVGWNDLVPTLLLYTGAILALAWPGAAPLLAALMLATLVVYLGWRAHRPPASSGWSAWVTGGWVQSTPRWSRWLTGDFIT
jgi:hypothetical protein